MEVKIKQKLANGKIVKGLINERLEEITPFEFSKITEGEFKNFYKPDKYFICEKEDGTCSIYDDEGNLRINYTDGYSNLKVLKCNTNIRSLKVVATKDNQVGILECYLEETKNNCYEPKVKTLYKFGKCDEIKELDDTSVMLIKHTKTGNHIGYWYHKDIGELIEPTYLSYDYNKIECKKRIGLYRHKDKHEEFVDLYSYSDCIEFEKLTHNVELIKYSKLKNKKEVFGLKQKVSDLSKTSGNYSYSKTIKFEDFLEPIYSKISYDEEKQIFFLEQIINKKVQKGFAGVTFDWQLGGRGWRIWGYPNFKIEVNIPCTYDDLIIDDNYVITKKDNKYGLIKYAFGKSNGDYDYFNRKNCSRGSCQEIAPCIYDDITKKGNYFIGSLDDEKVIITDCIDKETKQPIVVANNYKKITLPSMKPNIFLGELENNKKEVIILTEDYQSYKPFLNSLQIEKLPLCDSANVINNDKSDTKNLIKITNDGVTNIYLYVTPYSRNHKSSGKIAQDIGNYYYDQDNNMLFIQKQNNHIFIIDTRPGSFADTLGDIIFTTENLNLVPKNLKVEYLQELDSFKVTNDNQISIQSRLSNNNIFAERKFLNFDTLKTPKYTFVGYTEIFGNTLQNCLAYIKEDLEDIRKKKENVILKGNFQVENIVLNGKRIIVKIEDKKTKTTKFGVIESEKGKICIDFIYDNIEFDSSENIFICTSGNEKKLFDEDGFLNENQSVYTSPTRKILKLTSKNN